MQGRRLENNTFPHDMEDGDYSKAIITPAGGGEKKINWFIKTPNGISGNLVNHIVHENADGSITVKPEKISSNSILAQEFVGGTVTKSWHGYIDQGFWKEC